MGYLAREGASLIRIRDEHILPLLEVLDFDGDEDLGPQDNLIDCLIDLDWECVSRDNDCLSFRYVNSGDHDDGMDWEAFLAMAPFLEEGSFFEERPGDYIEDLAGNSCTGVMQAIVEGGVLHCRLYALVQETEGQKIRQLVQTLDPSLF